ncbi:DNA-binding transcriptional regulator, MerR family [Nocardioides exalbidus]|uniref:DNA-binding transcriptional regulator, MerR family n=1 Tax=Nocardioides exalbidus TaxID=402596 RepID=A0A1H4L751_9ACTN|nr:MerR family transcriptional regulator [Nocardioides exalbidus]SEB66155.1 DNA-binding transcriptional regulator, MerR family [Nocardioides exalbidus]
MSLPFAIPRQVKIGDAAAFVGTTPRAIRHYHEIGLLPEPERGSDDRRRYGYDDMIRLLWIRRMADAGIALDDIRAAFTDPAPAQSDGTDDQELAAILQRLEGTLAAREAELREQRSAVQRMLAAGSRRGLLSDLVTTRLAGVPEGSLRQADLDTLLVTERIFGPLGAAIQAGRFVALAAHPDLQEESDSVDAAEEALDDTVDVDDPRVAEVAERRHAFELALNAVIEESGQAEEEERFFDSWEASQAGDVDAGPGSGQGSTGVLAAVEQMPYDFSPARVRCLELVAEMLAEEPLAR